MKKGRITKEEQARRFKLLLRFIFTFRYATRKQLDIFSKLIIGLKHPQWLVDYWKRNKNKRRLWKILFYNNGF